MDILANRDNLIFNRPPQRVASLVPSITESLFDLGFGNSVIGITDYCTYPVDKVANLTRLGGPKNPSIEAIRLLQPDLVIANQEENTPETIKALEHSHIPVWLTFPKTVRESIEILWDLVGFFQSKTAAIQVDTLERTLEWVEAEAQSRSTWRYFCPIWQSDPNPNDVPAWWMTFNRDTYPNDLLCLFGGENIFAERIRHYPLEADLGLIPAEPNETRDTRYPRVTHKEILTGDPEVILLPNEPFGYDDSYLESNVRFFESTTAAAMKRILLVDGSLLTWHGTRLAKALTELGNLLDFPGTNEIQVS